MNKLEIKLPTIPQGASTEMHQYLVELHRNLQKVQNYVNTLNTNKADK